MIQAEDKAEDVEEHVKVAVIDSGVDWGNDINLVYQVSLVPGEEEMTQVFMDGSGHGSSVASLIAAKDNGEGITGINPNVDIYSYRVLGDGNEAPVSRVVEAIYMAIEKNVNIINMSFGVSEYSEALKQAVRDANKAGILIIAAAGNTGEDGVQYPAAFEEVMAVGAVNKYGTVEEYSAKGKELEVVAPGELVKTTGFIDSVEVTSGTSLAAPQVTAIASLIWQKDLSVSPDFVRGLLDESANLYGETDLYGNGLIDAEYALNHYEEYKRKYEKATDEEDKLNIPENKSKIVTFEDTGCVKGCWRKTDHVKMVNAGYYNVRAGARLPDDITEFKIATYNPWWHGYFKMGKDKTNEQESNYLKAVFTITSIADAVYRNGRTQYDTYTYTKYKLRHNLVEDLKSMDTNKQWAEQLKKIKSSNSDAKDQEDTKGFRRAIIWGMAIHCATDIYAHSACVNGKLINHDDLYNGEKQADCMDYILDRHSLAVRAAKQMLTAYADKRQPDIFDIIPLRKFDGFTLKNLSQYAKEFDTSLAGVINNYGYNHTSK